MPGKRARRHFSQLSEFQRGLIIGMKAAGRSTHRVADQVDRSECAVTKLLGAVDMRRYPRAENRVRSDLEDHDRREDRRIVRQAIVDPTVTRSTI
ncbi:uncharacterized protein TNCV_1759411 [Trichonephila clavipes]|nr:uncharacterized protein TNCV_1759411 [Trichonephila clavipes]